MATERLDKIIASRSALSRSVVRKLVQSGVVKVNGAAATDPAMRIDTSVDAVLLHGKPFSQEKHLYIMMNKPEGVVSASEGHGDKTVVDLVPQELSRPGLFPAGRLDKDTTGFVLITDDGEFAHRILAPKSHVFKTYEVLLDHPIDESDISSFADGVELYDGTVCLHAQLSGMDGSWARVKIREGKYHQIKRMFASRGNKVLRLRRTHIGGVEIDENLADGECRLLTAEEIERITEGIR